MELSLNPQILIIQLLIYLSIIVVLKFLYFDPILVLLRKRDSLTTGRKKDVEGMQIRLRQLLDQFDARMNGVRSDLEKEREQELKTVRERTEKILSAAKAKVEERMSGARKELSAEIEKVRSRIPQAAGDISKEIVSSIMRSKVVRA